MTLRQLQELTGVKGIRKVSEHTVVVEFMNGTVRPATPLEVQLWHLLTSPVPAG